MLTLCEWLARPPLSVRAMSLNLEPKLPLIGVRQPGVMYADVCDCHCTLYCGGHLAFDNLFIARQWGCEKLLHN